MRLIDRTARALLAGRLSRIRGGRLTLTTPDGTQPYGQLEPLTGRAPLDATLTVHRDRFFTRALLGSDIGIGESYVDGDWSTPDLVALARLFIRNSATVDVNAGVAARLTRTSALWARRLRDNTLDGSRRHVREHYDLGNDFFRLFLDERMVYSSAYYVSGNESLEAAQHQKLDLICRKLSLGPRDQVLEIGTGWGGFAVYAASRYGCRVTTTTISDEQYRVACESAARLPTAASRVTVLNADYRRLEGQFDKIVSIEMFEAVGLRHYDEYFLAAERLLRPNGSMLLQTITMNEQQFPAYRASADWIEKYIFPGGALASVAEILRSLARVTSMSLHHAENFGIHYAKTLHEWRARFHQQIDAVRALGYSDRFIRTWDFYLAICEAAFLERHTGVFQLVINRNYTCAQMFNEPTGRPEHLSSSVARAASAARAAHPGAALDISA